MVVRQGPEWCTLAICPLLSPQFWENANNPKARAREWLVVSESQRELGRTVMPCRLAVDFADVTAGYRRTRPREVVLVVDGGAVLPRRTSLVGYNSIFRSPLTNLNIGMWVGVGKGALRT